MRGGGRIRSSGPHGERVMRRAPVARLVALAMALSASLQAQQSAARPGVIDGLISDAAMQPLAEATISIVGSEIQVVTGPNGRFLVLGLPSGRFTLLARHVGYEPVTLPLDVVAGDTLRVAIELEKIGTALDAVKVIATERSLRFAEFEERRSAGVGVFMTEAEIEKRNSVSLADLLHLMVPLKTRFGGATRACQEQYYLDGIAISPPKGGAIASDLPSPKDIAGIEYYSGPAQMPLQYKSLLGSGFCGVVLLWTK